MAGTIILVFMVFGFIIGRRYCIFDGRKHIWHHSCELLRHSRTWDSNFQNWNRKILSKDSFHLNPVINYTVFPLTLARYLYQDVLFVLRKCAVKGTPSRFFTSAPQSLSFCSVFSHGEVWHFIWSAFKWLYIQKKRDTAVSLRITSCKTVFYFQVL